MAVLWLWFLLFLLFFLFPPSSVTNVSHVSPAQPFKLHVLQCTHTHRLMFSPSLPFLPPPPLSILKYIYLACVLEHTNDLCLFPSSCCWQWLRSTAPASSVEQVSSGAFHCCSEIWITNASLWNLLSPVHRAMGSRVCFIFYYFIHILSFFVFKRCFSQCRGRIYFLV